MRVTTRAALVAAICLALFLSAAGSGSAGATEGRPAEAGGVEDEEYEGPAFTLDEWLPAYASLRADLGFDEMPRGELRSLADSDEGRASLEDYGMVLTSDERREMDERMASADDVHRNVEPLALEIPGFAGIYVNSAHQKVVAFKGQLDDDTKIQLLQAARFPDRVLIREQMPYSEAEIEAIADDMRARFDAVDGVSIDPEFSEGIVIVKIRPEAQEDALLVDLDHPAVQTATDRSVGGDTVCTYRWNCHTYLRGGVKALNLTGGGWCTTGFFVELDSNGKKYLMVNAHCGDVDDDFKLGNLTSATLHYASLAVREESLDAQGILTADSQSSYRFFRTSATKARPIWTRVPNSQIDTSDVVCVHSYKLGRICGGIDDDSDDEQLGDFDTDDNFTFLINMPGSWGCTTGANNVGGTSGAPVTSTSGHSLYGQQHTCTDATYHPSNDTTTMRIWASKAQNIEDDMGVTILTGY